MRAKQRWVFGAALLAVLLLGGSRTVAACSMTYFPLPWLLATPQFDASSLPNGVTIAYRKHEAWGDGELLLTNSTTTPLYVLAKADDGFDGTRPETTMPSGYVATIKLVENVWFQRQGNQWVAVNQHPREAWNASLSALGIETYPQTADATLADRVVPPTLRSTLPLMYGDALIEVPTTVEFAPNPTYEPPRTRSGNPCSPLYWVDVSMPWCVVVLVGIITAACIWLRRPA